MQCYCLPMQCYCLQVACMRSNIPQVYIIHSANSSAGCDGGGQPGVHGEAGGGKGCRRRRSCVSHHARILKCGVLFLGVRQRAGPFPLFSIHRKRILRRNRGTFLRFAQISGDRGTRLLRAIRLGKTTHREVVVPGQKPPVCVRGGY